MPDGTDSSCVKQIFADCLSSSTEKGTSPQIDVSMIRSTPVFLLSISHLLWKLFVPLALVSSGEMCSVINRLWESWAIFNWALEAAVPPSFSDSAVL